MVLTHAEELLLLTTQGLGFRRGCRLFSYQHFWVGSHYVAKHDHFVAVLGKDGLVEHHIQILVVSLREEAHGLDVPGNDVH